MNKQSSFSSSNNVKQQIKNVCIEKNPSRCDDKGRG